MAKHTSQEAYYERLKNLANVNKTSVNETKNRALGTLIDYKRAADGVAYGIIKEQHHYYIKKGGLKADPDASDFAYIGGLGNITEYQFGKLAEADKNRNMLLKVVNEGVKTKVNPSGSKKKVNLNEDKAAQEIGDAEGMLGDLDAATAAEEIPATEPAGDEMAAGLEAEPAGGEEVAADAEVSAEPAPEGGEGDAAADLEASLGGEEGGDAAADLEASLGGEEGGDEVDAEVSAEEPVDGGEEEVSADAEVADDEEYATEDPQSETVRELEKQIGKITNTIRKTELEPSQTQGYLKSFIQAFKDKLPDLEIDERKKIAELITKIVPPKDMEDLGQSVEDSEVAAGIEQPEELGMAAESQCAECGSFAQYAESRGYGSAADLMECGDEELGNVVNGYANAHNDGMNDGDMENVALVLKIINPEILDQLKGDYGHEEYAEKLSPIVTGMNECSQEEGVAKLEELFGGVNATNAPIDPASLETQPPLTEDDDEEAEEANDDVVDVVGDEVEDEINFAPPAQSLGGGVVKPEGAGTTSVEVTKDSVSVTLSEAKAKLIKQIATGVNEYLKEWNFDKKKGEEHEEKAEDKEEDEKEEKAKDKKEVVSESELKLRKYIRARLEEKAGLRKPVLTENKKSDALKRLDATIDKQFKLHETVQSKKKVNEEKVNEVFGWSMKEKFANLDPNDKQGVNKLFYQAFRDILNNPKMGAIFNAAKKTPLPERYEILKQFVEQGGGTLRTSAGEGVVFAPKDVKNAAIPSAFSSGGTQGKTQLGGV